MHRPLNTVALRTIIAASAVLALAACGEQASVGPSKPNLNHTGDPPPFDKLGHFAVCKVGSDATFDVVVNGGAATQVSLTDGQCQDVALTPVGGGFITVTVTEETDPSFTLQQIQYDSLSRSSSGSRIVTGTNSITATINGDIQGTATFTNQLVPAQPGRMTGGVKQFDVNGVAITRGFTIHCDLILSNNLEINWPAHKWHITKPLTGALCLDDPAYDQKPPVAPFNTFIGDGVGEYDGVGGSTVHFTFIDAGEPGSGVDKAAIQIKDVNGVIVLDLPLTVLAHGNIQAHYDQPHGNKP